MTEDNAPMLGGQAQDNAPGLSRLWRRLTTNWQRLIPQTETCSWVTVTLDGDFELSAGEMVWIELREDDAGEPGEVLARLRLASKEDMLREGYHEQEKHE
jgi:hypothetical protein